MRTRLGQLNELITVVRRHILRATTTAGSGHPSSALSAVELMVALLFGGVFRANLNKPELPNNDRLIFSKGHAAPLLYALYAAAGKVTPRELLKLRTFGSQLEGHPMPAFPYTEVPTGSLGQGLSVGVGMALAARADRLSYRTYVLLGDSEMTEGSVWEALTFAGHERLANLTAILDVNRLGQRGETMLGHRLQQYADRIRPLGWATQLINGHNVSEVLAAYRAAQTEKRRPTIIIAKTLKGKGVAAMENRQGWHGKPLPAKLLPAALAAFGSAPANVLGAVAQPAKRAPRVIRTRKPRVPNYAADVPVAPRAALGNALIRLQPVFPNLIVLDAEVSNSTHTERFGKRFPRQFIEAYIAEQNMIGLASGLAKRGKLPVAATFAAFLTRAHDQLRMLQYAKTHAVIIGTHPGVAIGPDGPSQMGLDDLAMFRAFLNSAVYYPSDAYAAERLLELALAGKGLVYLRATRNPLPVIYDASTKFKPGGSHVLRQSRQDRATIVAAGTTLQEALNAADSLAQKRIRVRVIDLYSVKPLDLITLRRAAEATGHLIVVEDHVEPGGMADAVRAALGKLAGTVTSLAVNQTPGSGTSRELLVQQGIDAATLVDTVQSLV